VPGSSAMRRWGLGAALSIPPQLCAYNFIVIPRRKKIQLLEVFRLCICVVLGLRSAGGKPHHPAYLVCRYLVNYELTHSAYSLLEKRGREGIAPHAPCHMSLPGWKAFCFLKRTFIDRGFHIFKNVYIQNSQLIILKSVMCSSCPTTTNSPGCKILVSGRASVAHACNSSCLGGSLSATPGRKLARPSSQTIAGCGGMPVIPEGWQKS
jgi:hypothetical protein